MRAHAASWSCNSLYTTHLDSEILLLRKYIAISLVDKLLDRRKEEFKLPNKKKSCVLNHKENLKLLKEKEMKKKKEEEKKAQ